jgi:Cu+-exporting ATPase
MDGNCGSHPFAACTPRSEQTLRGIDASYPSTKKPAGVRDPVCGMTVDPEQAAGMLVDRRRIKARLTTSARRVARLSFRRTRKSIYIRQPRRPMQAAGVEYTCPMHPEIRQIGPGSCPKCGMALEPVSITLDSADEINPEYTDMLRRFWFSVPPSAALLGMMFAGLHWPWLEFILATLWCCGRDGRSSARVGVHRESQPNMFTLIGAGAGAAYAYSFIAAMAPGIFPAEMRVHGRSKSRCTLSRRP